VETKLHDVGLSFNKSWSSDSDNPETESETPTQPDFGAIFIAEFNLFVIDRDSVSKEMTHGESNGHVTDDVTLT